MQLKYCQLVLPIILKIERETVSLIIVYHIPGPLGSFIEDFISLINELPRPCRMLIVSDFNLDQMLPEHVAKVDPLIKNFNLSYRWQYWTHIHGETLNLVFETSISNTVSSLSSPCSDHFVLFFQIWCIIFIQNLAVNNLAFNRHYITYKYLCWRYLDTEVSENLLWKQWPKQHEPLFLV